MVDSKEKGARGEIAVRDLLREYTELQWERIPMSGALAATHQLKGDLYIVNCNNVFCVECKNYAEDHLNSKLLTSKESQIEKWWQQTSSQAKLVQKRPLLFFKHDRSKVFVATDTIPDNTPYIYVSKLDISICVAEQWLVNEDIEWTK